jgi:hypothetical protein
LRSFVVNRERNLPFLLAMLAVTGVCASVTGAQSFSQIIGLCRNVTVIENIRDAWATRRNPYRRDCLTNYEEVCGARAWLPLWCCPIPLPRIQDGFGYDLAEGDEERRAFLPTAT